MKLGRKPLFEANKPFDEYAASTNLLELARSYQQMSKSREAKTPTGKAPNTSFV